MKTTLFTGIVVIALVAFVWMIGISVVSDIGVNFARMSVV